MKLLLLCAKAFETMEFSAFIDIFGWAREDYACDITVCTCGFDQIVTSTFGVSIKVDILIDAVRMEDFDALAIPGGFREHGFGSEAYHEKTLKLIRAFDNAEKPIAAVCVAAFALAKSGILNGRKATTYHLRGGECQRELEAYGVWVINEPVVVDKNVITSYCPQTAAEVAFTLLAMLAGTETMVRVKGAMGF